MLLKIDFKNIEISFISFSSSGDVYGRCADEHHNDDDIDVTKGVTFDGKNNDISIATEGKVRHKFYDEAGIEIEDDGIFDKSTEDVTLATEADEGGRVFSSVGEVEIDRPRDSQVIMIIVIRGHPTFRGKKGLEKPRKSGQLLLFLIV